MSSQQKLAELYAELLDKHGPQGWWPLDGKYHPTQYDFPKNKQQEFEICAGAILTQSVAWKNVEKVITNLRSYLNPTAILRLSDAKLQSLIRPAGYFRQKARKLKEFAAFYNKLKRTPSRSELLSVWGIGRETADSMLLYAFKTPVFVVDAYTIRLFKKKRIIPETYSVKEYDSVQQLVHARFTPDLEKYQEFHALIVEEGKSINK